MNIEQLATNFTAGIPTNAQDFPVLVRLSGDGSGEVRSDRNSGELRTAPDGRPTHRVAGQVLNINREGQVGIAQGAFINSIEPLEASLDLFAVQVYRGVGKVWVKAFANDQGRIAYSLTVEKLVPVQAQAVAQGEK